MQKWEYLILQESALFNPDFVSRPLYDLLLNGESIHRDDSIEPNPYPYLQKLGSEGWEMVGITHLYNSDSASPRYYKVYNYCFKRPVREDLD